MHIYHAARKEGKTMPDILQRVGIKASPETVYAAITTLDGLAGWWTTDTKGNPAVNGKTKFTFGDKGFFEMKTLEAKPSSHLLWEVTDGPPEWIGTKIRFDLKEEDGQTTILFKHEDWREPVEFMHHCSTKWAIFLMSLKSLVETGTGSPFPDDVKIDNWN